MGQGRRRRPAGRGLRRRLPEPGDRRRGHGSGQSFLERSAPWTAGSGQGCVRPRERVPVQPQHRSRARDDTRLGVTMTHVELAADTDQIADPSTYVRGVPYHAFARLRRAAPAVWVDEPARGPLPAGTGFWAVLRHDAARRVLRSPQVFSSSLGLTQIFDAPPPLRAYM